MKDFILKDLMIMLNAEIDENGDIRCLCCGSLNECCECKTSKLNLNKGRKEKLQ